MLYWTPTEVRAFTRRWTILKALIAALMLTLPSLPAVDTLLGELGVFRGAFMMFWYVLGGVVWVWGCADYSRSKGYSGWWGLLCAPLPLGPFGLVALFLFPDRWDPKHSDWRTEADPLLIDGQRMRSARDARQMLRTSCMQKLIPAGVLWIAVLVLTSLIRNTVSNDSSTTLQIIAYGLSFTASFIGVWGAAHLARLKGYSQFWALSGFALIPVAMGLLMGSGLDFIALALMLMAFLLGPVALLLMPDQWHDVGISPMQFNPNEMSDLAPEPIFVDHHHVRIVSDY